MTDEDKIERNFRLFQSQIDRFGSTRSPLQLQIDGERVVVAGSNIYKIPHEWSFSEFLLSYGLELFGRQIVDAEPNRSSPQHPMAKQLLALKMVAKRLENGRVSLVAGSLELDAFIRFSWDLFTVADNAHLQGVLVKRLGNPDQYQGARYELVVAASFLRAGFRLEFEDEGNVEVSHCEFTATHKRTGKRYSVEAKSRHRKAGVKYDNVGVTRLLQKALSKVANHERLIFIDVNLPHYEGAAGLEPWQRQIGETLVDLEKRQKVEYPWPNAIVFATNGTFAMSNQGGGRLSTVLLTAINHPLFLQPDMSLVKSAYPELGLLYDSLLRLGNPPQDFPGFGTGFNVR